MHVFRPNSHINAHCKNRFDYRYSNNSHKDKEWNRYWAASLRAPARQITQFSTARLARGKRCVPAATSSSLTHKGQQTEPSLDPTRIRPREMVRSRGAAINSDESAASSSGRANGCHRGGVCDGHYLRRVEKLIKGHVRNLRCLKPLWAEV